MMNVHAIAFDLRRMLIENDRHDLIGRIAIIASPEEIHDLCRNLPLHDVTRSKLIASGSVLLGEYAGFRLLVEE